MPVIDYMIARNKLSDCFDETLKGIPPEAQQLLLKYQEAFNIVFESKMQSYREVLLGCALIHYLSPETNIRLPYVKQGVGAFNGRTLDEQVINPFLMSRQIPCSKGPYLATFRRNVKLDISTRSGLRDQTGYDAMLTILDIIEKFHGEEAQIPILCLLQKFVELREQSDIQLVSVSRMSIEQYQKFLSFLLHNQSGGLLPMLVSEAIFTTINLQFNCGWKIQRQGLNAADGATGALGDITIYKDGKFVKAIEVTERPIEDTRVIMTYNTKILTSGVEDYLFVYTAATPSDAAYAVAKTYFAQGYDINFTRLSNLVMSVFIVGNADTRTIFMDKMLELLRKPDVPAIVKTAWNDALQSAISE